ncbi:Nn.00g063070.m01.CDS01 [Neocucurbitaria sp. VM-36]
MFKAYSASNMAFDFAIFLTPLVLFGTPNLRLKNVLAMAGVFAFGAIVVAISIWRLYGITVTRAGTHPYLDFTWWSPTMIILSCLEIDLAIVCASMPIFWPIIEKSLAAIFVSYELEVVEERVDDHGLVYELEHMEGRENSLKSSGTSTQELTNEEDEEGGLVGKVYTVGPDPLSEEARTVGLKTDVRSKPKPRWEL